MYPSKHNSTLNLQIYQEACEWLISLRTSGPEATTRERFDAWLRKSPEHVRAFLEVSGTWEDIAQHDSARMVSAAAHIARARAEDTLIPLGAKQIRNSTRPSERLRGFSARKRTAFALAASIVLILVAVGFRTYRDRGIYTTAVGEERTMPLSDGSVIELNADSRIRVSFFKNRREVDLLRGEALFKVVHDASRPFIVRSGTAIIHDLGTEFDVYRKTTGTTVTVIEGRVAVGSSAALPLRPSGGPSGTSGSTASTERSSSNRSRESSGLLGSGLVAARNEEVLVTAGEQVTVLHQAILQPINVNVASATAWTQRQLVFDSVPLSQVVRTFNRYNTRPLIIDDAQLKDFRVIGVFSSTDPSSLIRFLSAQAGISVVESADEVRITREHGEPRPQR